MTAPQHTSADIILPLDQARWLQHTLREAAGLIDHHHEPRHLHHDLNYHAVWLQRRLDAAPDPDDTKERS